MLSESDYSHSGKTITVLGDVFCASCYNKLSECTCPTNQPPKDYYPKYDINYTFTYTKFSTTL